MASWNISAIITRGLNHFKKNHFFLIQILYFYPMQIAYTLNSNYLMPTEEECYQTIFFFDLAYSIRKIRFGFPLKNIPKLLLLSRTRIHKSILPKTTFFQQLIQELAILPKSFQIYDR